MVIEAEPDAEQMDKLAKLGLASEIYRTTASKAFKGVEKRDELTFEDAKSRLEKAITDAGYRLVSAEPYVAPEKQAEMKKATTAYEDAVKAGQLDHIAKKLKVDAADKDAVIAAIHRKLFPSKADVMEMLTK